jgi:PAS domain S-box-containing protein
VRYEAEVMGGDRGRELVTIDVDLTPVGDGAGELRFVVLEGVPRHEAVGNAAAAAAAGYRSWVMLVAELAGARAQNDALRQLASSLAASRTVDEVCTAIANHLAPCLGAAFSNVAFVPPEAGELQLFQPDDLDSAVADRWVTAPLDDTLPLGVAALTGRSVLVGSRTAIAERFPAAAADADRMGFRSLAAHPVTVDDGRVRAAIGLGWTTETETLDDSAIDPAIALCGAALQRAWISDEWSRIAALLDTLLQQAPVGFAFIDRDFRFSHINHRLAETNGLSVGEHLGRRIDDVVPELAGQITSVLRRVFDDGESLTGIEVSGETPAQPGRTRIWEEGFYPVRAPGLGVIGAGVVVVEVTEQHEERAALREMAVQEREVARRLQAGLLPTSIPDIAGYEVCARYEPGTAGLRVGGDWYEIVEIRPGDLAIVVGDAVGHDLDAAIAMSQIRHALTGLSHAHDDPATIIEQLDEYAAHTPEALASTLFYARLDPSTGELRYTLAGHHPPLLVHRSGRHDWFDARPGPPIGVAAERFTATCRLEPGDTIIGYTDGLIEHHDEPIEAGRQRLVDVAISHPDASPQRLVDDLVAKVPNADRRDDIVVLAIHRTLEAR